MITGKMPRGLFDLMVLANSYTARSDAYLYLLTETYPPFQDEQTRARSRGHPGQPPDQATPAYSRRRALRPASPGCAWRASSRRLPAACAKRRISSSRSCVGLDDGVDHQLGGEVQDVDVLARTRRAAARCVAARSSSSSIAWSWL